MVRELAAQCSGIIVSNRSCVHPKPYSARRAISQFEKAYRRHSRTTSALCRPLVVSKIRTPRLDGCPALHIPLEQARYLRAVLTPIVRIAPEVNHDNDHLTQDRAAVRIRRAAPAVAEHDRIAAQQDTLCIYTDASLCDDSRAGMAATIPSLNETILEQLDAISYPRRSYIAEFCGVTLGLELGAERAAFGQCVALFTDCNFEKHVTDTDAQLPEVQYALGRAALAVKRLAEKNATFSLNLIPGHRGVIDGIILAHRGAKEAALPFEQLRKRIVEGPTLIAGLAFDDVKLFPQSGGYYMPPKKA